MDVFALVLSYLALRLSALPADDRHTYGFHRLEVLAALINGILLGAIAIAIFFESWQRWQNPQPVKSVEMLIIATIGLVANLIVVFVLGGHDHDEHEHEGEREDLNVRSVFLHVVGDAVSSVGVIVAAGIIWYTGWEWVDPLVSVLIGILILLSSWRCSEVPCTSWLRGSPKGLRSTKSAKAWPRRPACRTRMACTSGACARGTLRSVRTSLSSIRPGQAQTLLDDLKNRLQTGFGVGHTTIQFECASCGQGRTVGVNGNG